MKSKLHLKQELQLNGITYKVIGIDTYSLKNIKRKNHKWISYTLQANNKQKTWISYHADTKQFIQWTNISEEEFNKDKTKEIYAELSGIANITFEGNPGYSTPNTDTIWFTSKNPNYEYLGLERFLKIKDNYIKPEQAYFMTGKVLKDFTV